MWWWVWWWISLCLGVYRRRAMIDWWHAGVLLPSLPSWILLEWQAAFQMRLRSIKLRSGFKPAKQAVGPFEGDLLCSTARPGFKQSSSVMWAGLAAGSLLLKDTRVYVSTREVLSEQRRGWVLSPVEPQGSAWPRDRNVCFLGSATS